MKPLLLDTFCKAGGCTKGDQRAGFYVVGVDIDQVERIEKITVSPRKTIVQVLTEQLRTDVEIGMSFDKGSKDGYYWQGVVSGTQKAIEIVEKWEKEK